MNEDKKGLNLPRLALSLAISVGAGVIAWLFSMNASKVYQSLKQPVFAPPSWLFAPVWTVLYISMGIALYLVLKHSSKELRVKNAFVYFVLQLIFNVLWSVLFFTLNLRAAALVDIIILAFYAGVTAVKFFKIDKKAGIIMMIYFIWILYAVLLNAAVVIMNG